MLNKKRISWPIGASGQGLVEYALVLVLVAIATILIVGLLGEQITDIFCDIVYSMGDSAPDVEVCEAPRVTCSGITGGTVSNPVTIEAVIRNDEGDANIDRVEFYLDGEFYLRERLYRYCFGTGDDSCDGANLPPGNHTVRAVVYDDEGLSDECSVSFTVAP